jgi:hypothetical protein
MSFRVAGSRKCAFAPLADLLDTHGGNGAGTLPDLPLPASRHSAHGLAGPREDGQPGAHPSTVAATVVALDIAHH